MARACRASGRQSAVSLRRLFKYVTSSTRPRRAPPRARATSPRARSAAPAGSPPARSAAP
eukprot:scaffold87031_cov57-Phaeocystis_antarctica.AAC.4